MDVITTKYSVKIDAAWQSLHLDRSITAGVSVTETNYHIGKYK